MPPAPGGQPAKPGRGRIGEAQGTIGADGRRVWIYARETKGRFTSRRRLVAWFLLAAYLGTPWLHWRGESLLRLDWYGQTVVVGTRHFWAQDLPLFLPAFFACVVTAFALTARFGRIWCGWACPQTVFLQFLFGPVERLIEGKASKRQQRDQAGFSFDWLWRKAAKQAVFLFMSLWIGNTALAYFWGTQNLMYAIAHPSAQNWPGLALVIPFTAVFYFIFAFFKEQACIILCPYARFQSVLVDEKTSVIAYDARRGEMRGKGEHGSRQGLGDCTDCLQCVLVCPTGIDIRMGQQLECIGCARCIDACDQTMAAWKKPVGLVRYASLSELQGKPKGKPWRLLAYAVLAVVMASVSGTLLLRRPVVALDIVRRGASPYVHQGADSVTNNFTLHLRNNSSRRRILTMAWEGAPLGNFNWANRSFALSGGQSMDLPVDITAPITDFRRGAADARLMVTGQGVKETLPVRLAGPWGQ